VAQEGEKLRMAVAGFAFAEHTPVAMSRAANGVAVP
jgi:hypothetical protein